MSPKQLKCIELLAKGEMTQKDIAAELKLNPSTISKWKLDHKFMEAVVDRAKELLKESVPQVYKALTDKSKAGHDRHIKILLDHMEKLEEVRAQRGSITFTWDVPHNE